MPKGNKNYHKFSYPHPIAKHPKPDSQQVHPHSSTTPQPLIMTDMHSLPSGLISSTHIQPVLGSNFSLLVHPLHPKVQADRYQSKNILVCPKCFACMNSTVLQKISIFEYKCRFCHHGISCQFGSGIYADCNVFDKLDQISNLSKTDNRNRKLLFVIQANQYVYEKQVSASIFQCLRALSLLYVNNVQQNKSTSGSTSQQSENSQANQTQKHYNMNMKSNLFSNANEQNTDLDIKVGFMLFDSKNMYLLNLQNNQLTIIQPQEFSTIQQFPLLQEQMFEHLSLVDLGTIEEIVNQIIYQAYKNHSCTLFGVLQVCDFLVKSWALEVKLFGYSFDLNRYSSPSTDRSNNTSKKNTQIGNTLKISPKCEIYLLDNSLYNNFAKVGLTDNIYRSYQFSRVDSTDIYYDLYHNITEQAYYDVSVEVICSELVRTRSKVNKWSRIDANRCLVLDFQVQGSSANTKGKVSHIEGKLDSQYIQIKLTLDCLTQRVITYKLPKILTKANNHIYLLNDDTFFYATVYKLLTHSNTNTNGKQKTNASIKQSLMSKCKRIIKQLGQADEQQCYIPKNLTNFFMYAYMILQHPICGSNSSNRTGNSKCSSTDNDCKYERQVFKRQGLETITKMLYPKVYQFYPQIKPVKFRPKSFLHNTIRVVDNGLFIGIVFGDQVKQQTIQKLLGVSHIEQAIKWRDLPIINNKINQQLHQLVNSLRELNQLYYLPIKIMELDSQDFQTTYGNYLYIEEDHRKFFTLCFKN